MENRNLYLMKKIIKRGTLAFSEVIAETRETLSFLMYGIVNSYIVSRSAELVSELTSTMLPSIPTEVSLIRYLRFGWVLPLFS